MSKCIKLLFGGDVSPREGEAAEKLLQRQALFSSPLLNEVHQADLCIVNLETVLGNAGKPLPKIGVHLRTDAQLASILKKSGIDRVNLANNHIFDYGIDGVEETLQHLDEANIQYMGVGDTPDAADQLKIHVVKGIRIGFLVYAEHEFNYSSDDTPGTAVLNPEKNVLYIQASKKRCDILIVFTHCGPEGHNVPSPRMVRMFHAFADAGADAVINCHAHCVMGKEIYKTIPIYYGLGNLFFPTSEKSPNWWYHGIMAELTFEDTKFVQSREIMTSFQDQDCVKLASNKDQRIKDFWVISQYCTDSAKIEKCWLDFCRNQKKHLCKQIVKGVLAIAPYFLLSKFSKSKKWKNDDRWSAKGIRMFRGLLSCENHVDEFRTILNDIMQNGL